MLASGIAYLDDPYMYGGIGGFEKDGLLHEAVMLETYDAIAVPCFRGVPKRGSRQGLERTRRRVVR